MSDPDQVTLSDTSRRLVARKGEHCLLTWCQRTAPKRYRSGRCPNSVLNSRFLRPRQVGSSAARSTLTPLPTLATAMAELPAGDVTVDVADVSFMDSSGLRVLIDAAARAREEVAI